MSSSKKAAPYAKENWIAWRTWWLVRKDLKVTTVLILRVDIRVEAGTSVHNTCLINHINQKDIAQSVKRSARVSLGAYDRKT